MNYNSNHKNILVCFNVNTPATLTMNMYIKKYKGICSEICIFTWQNKSIGLYFG